MQKIGRNTQDKEIGDPNLGDYDPICHSTPRESSKQPARGLSGLNSNSPSLFSFLGGSSRKQDEAKFWKARKQTVLCEVIYTNDDS
jgi:hypothetical protein